MNNFFKKTHKTTSWAGMVSSGWFTEQAWAVSHGLRASIPLPTALCLGFSLAVPSLYTCKQEEDRHEAEMYS